MAEQYAENRKVFFDYEILEKFEAGIELLGFEVKATRNGQAALEGSYIGVRGGEAFLLGATIAPYQPANTSKDYDSRRTRKLLLTKKEISTLQGFEQKKGLTIVPLSLYNKGRRIKVGLAVVRGKKKYDKRATIKKRESNIEIERIMKER